MLQAFFKSAIAEELRFFNVASVMTHGVADCIPEGTICVVCNQTNVSTCVQYPVIDAHQRPLLG